MTQQTDRLTKGMYTDRKSPSNLFGLREGQMPKGEFVHNGGWYNGKGEKLGWGDLSVDNFHEIEIGLEEGEVFVVLPERESYWAFADRDYMVNIQGRQAPIGELDIEAPGVDYVADNASYIITLLTVYRIDDYEVEEDGAYDAVLQTRGGPLEATVVSRATARKLLASMNVTV